MRLSDLLNKFKKTQHPSQFDYVYDKDRYAYILMNRDGKYYSLNEYSEPIWIDNVKDASVFVTDSEEEKDILKSIYSGISEQLKDYPDMFADKEVYSKCTNADAFGADNTKDSDEINPQLYFKYIMNPHFKIRNPKAFHIKKVRYWDYFAKKIFGGHIFPCFYYTDMAPYLAYDFKEEFSEYDIEQADRFKELLKEQIGEFRITNVGDTTTIGYPSIIGKELSDEFEKGEICEYIATSILNEVLDVDEDKLFEALNISNKEKYLLEAIDN